MSARCALYLFAGSWLAVVCPLPQSTLGPPSSSPEVVTVEEGVPIPQATLDCLAAAIGSSDPDPLGTCGLT